MTNPTTSAGRACPACGASGQGKFCGECGTPLATEGAEVRQLLRADAAETVGWDDRLLGTLRDLLRHPVRIVGAYMRGERKQYLPPLRLFFTLGGLYMLALSVVQPYSFDAATLRERGVRAQDAVRVEQNIRERGMPLELFNERFEQRMNAVTPVATAVVLLPMVLLLRLLDRRRSWYEHFMFMLGTSNVVWLASLLLLPASLLSSTLHQVAVLGAMYVYMGITFFAFYPGRTRGTTAMRYALFAVVDLMLSSLLSVALMTGVYLSVLLV